MKQQFNYHTTPPKENNMKKVIAINGSPRKGWNTDTLLKKALEGAASVGAETEMVYLYDLKFRGCVSCMACKLRKEPRPCRCIQRDDLTAVLDRLHEADAVIIGSPIYFSEVTGELRSFLERFLFQYLNYDDYSKPLSSPKKTAMVISGYWPLVVMLVCYLTNFKNTMWGYIGCKCVCNLFGVGGNSMITSNFRDAATYTEWKTGENVSSLALGCIPIPLQIMGLIKGVMDPLLLKSANYSEAAIQAEVAAGDHTMSTKIAFFYMVIPAISSAIFATIMLLFFPTSKKVDQWRAEIDARKAEKEAAKA